VVVTVLLVALVWVLLAFMVGMLAAPIIARRIR
jgi:hypothetical protein